MYETEDLFHCYGTKGALKQLELGRAESGWVADLVEGKPRVTYSKGHNGSVLTRRLQRGRNWDR